MIELKEIRVPEIGGQAEIPVVEILVAVGDTIEAEQPIATLESDKATLEVPSPLAGIVRELKVVAGARVSQGSPIALIEVASSSRPADKPTPTAIEPAPLQREVPATTLAPPARWPAEQAASDVPHASPAVRRLARELGVDLRNVTGSERAGRISAADLQRHVKALLARAERSPLRSVGRDDSAAAAAIATPAAPTIDFARFGEVTSQPLSRIRRLAGTRLARSWSITPQVTQHEEADITELEALRVTLNAEHANSGAKITLLAFLLKACASALKQFPQVNASLDPDCEHIILKKYFHIGFAADTADGLLVPVIRDVDRKGIIGIASEIADLAAKARTGRLGLAEMSGGCFSISSLGGIGGTAFTPMVNTPEVAILGVSKAQWRPVWNGHDFAPRLVLPLSLSYDHRVIDGALAARFVGFVAAALADMRLLLL